MTARSLLPLMSAVALLLPGCQERNLRQQSNNTSETSERFAPRTGFARSGEVRIGYEVHGDLKGGQTPLIVLHGSLMSASSMNWLVDELVSTRPVIAIDARGHGRTGDVPGPITYAIMADDVAAVLRSLGVKKADVLGYSMGATTAAVAAVRHPHLIDKQILLSGLASRSGWHPKAQAAFEQWDYSMFKGTPVETAYKRVSSTPDALPSLVAKLRALESENYDVDPAALRAIRGKTMIIIGDADGVSFPETLKVFVDRGGDNTYVVNQGFLKEVPRARLAVLPATSHIGMMNQGPIIAQFARDFLDDRPPAPPSGFFEGMEKASQAAPDAS